MTTIDPNLSTKRLSGTTTEQDIVRAIVFSLDDSTALDDTSYLLAFPVGAVFKIVACPPIIKTVEQGIGVVDWQDQTVTVVDLRQKFFKRDRVFSSDSYRFLILMQTRSGELCGFPIEHSPTLIDLPAATIRPVPLSYRQVAGLNLASHMAVLPQPQGKDSLKIFLLALN